MSVSAGKYMQSFVPQSSPTRIKIKSKYIRRWREGKVNNENYQNYQESTHTYTHTGTDIINVLLSISKSPPLLNVLHLFSTLLCSAHYISPLLILSPLHLSYCPSILTYSILLCSILFMLYSIHLSSTIIYASNLFASPLYSSCHLFSSHLASTHHILFWTLLSSPLLSHTLSSHLRMEERIE